jgi:hypothetical protein
MSASVGRVVEMLNDCADDPMWCDHAEVPKRLLRKAAQALEEVDALAGHYMAQRDEERRRMALAVLALGIARQCIHAASSDHWQSFDALADDFDDATSDVMSAVGAMKITPDSLRKAVVQAGQMFDGREDDQ